MNKAAIVILAGTESHDDMGRVANALEAVAQFKDAGDDAALVFDGAGTGWVPKLDDKSHDLNELYQSVQDRVLGACHFCAGAFDVREEIEASSVPLLDEHNGHPDVHGLVTEGYQIITF